MIHFDRTCKALADSNRREILRHLKSGSKTAGELAEQVGLAPSAISFHLRILRDADLVDATRDGQFVVYRLNSSVVEDVMQAVADVFGVGESRAGSRRAAKRRRAEA